jgi:hypothetical protein
VEKANPSGAPAQKADEGLLARSGVASAKQQMSARFGSFAGLQHALGNQAMLSLLNSQRIQTKSRSDAGDEYEAEADRAAEIVQTRTRAPGLQRKCAGGDSCACKNCSGEDEERRQLSSTPPRIQRQAKDSKQPAGQSSADARQRQPRSLIVDDEAPSTTPGQMRKTAFIHQLRSIVCVTVNAALAGTPHSAQGCPYIEKWLAFYESKDSQHLEHALLKYAPEAKAARVANDYILIVARRVHQAALRWVKTGQLTGVPDELSRQVSTGGMFDSVGGFFSAIGSSVLGFLAGPPKSEDSEHQIISRKAREGASATPCDAGAVQAQLGSGRVLDSGARSRMESAFGHDFSGVRIHTDSRAASLSSDLNARAFTIGHDVAFGAGEYNPGSPVGDALLAHELAHVVQQGGGNGAPSAPMTKSTDQSAPSNQLEADANASALHAVTGIWGGAKHLLADIRVNAVPRLRSGLQLQRCPKNIPEAKTPEQQPKRPKTVPLDKTAADIVARAQDKSRKREDRAIEVVNAIVRTYYPGDTEKVASVLYDDDKAGTGLSVEEQHAKDRSRTKGTIYVGREFLEGDKQGGEVVGGVDERHFARRVLQVGHELEHIDQFRDPSLAGESKKPEREFRAFHHEALAPEKPGTGRMQHSSRVQLIHGALGYYNCLNDDLKATYRAAHDELVQRRSTEIRRSGNPESHFGSAPSGCVQQPD